DSIKDPCSISVGAPLGLAEMGLVTDIRVAGDGAVGVDIRLTGPGCMMGILYFDAEIKHRVAGPPGVPPGPAGRTQALSWSEADTSADGRARIEEARTPRLAFDPTTVIHSQRRRES